MRLEGKVAIITGADSGIGQGTATVFAKEGADVVVHYLEDRKGAEETRRRVEAAGHQSMIVQADLSDETQVERMFDEALGQMGRLDILMNNAGVDASGTEVADMETEVWERAIRTNLYGYFFCCRRFIRHRREQGGGGKIVNVTSVHEHVPLRGAAPYVAAKHGLGGLTKVLALELAEHGICVNAVAPGEIATPMTGGEDIDPHDRPRPMIPAGRPGDAREVAALIAWLCSPESGYVTGSSYVVDGGLTLMAAVGNQEAS